MKKEYRKPLVAVERFALVFTAARDCWDNIPQDQVNLSEHPCGWDLGSGNVLFNTSVVDSTCSIDGELSGMVCYNNPGEGHYMFRS
jgi:hypothetical protein